MVALSLPVGYKGEYSKTETHEQKPAQIPSARLSIHTDFSPSAALFPLKILHSSLEGLKCGAGGGVGFHHLESRGIFLLVPTQYFLM